MFFQIHWTASSKMQGPCQDSMTGVYNGDRIMKQVHHWERSSAERKAIKGQKPKKMIQKIGESFNRSKYKTNIDFVFVLMSRWSNPSPEKGQDLSNLSWRQLWEYLFFVCYFYNEPFWSFVAKFFLKCWFERSKRQVWTFWRPLIANIVFLWRLSSKKVPKDRSLLPVIHSTLRATIEVHFQASCCCCCWCRLSAASSQTRTARSNMFEIAK